MESANGDRASKLPYHVLIIGAGLGGLAAAIGIKQAGRDVTVLEKMTELREVRFCISLWNPSAKQSPRLGLAYKYRQTHRGS